MQQIQDDALLAAYRLMTADERAFFLQTAQVMTRNRPVYRPKLVLVGGSAAVPLRRVFNGSSRST